MDFRIVKLGIFFINWLLLGITSQLGVPTLLIEKSDMNFDNSFAVTTRYMYFAATLIGSLLAGFLLSHAVVALISALLINGIFTITTPFFGYQWLFQTVIFVRGLCSGLQVTCGIPIVVNTWREKSPIALNIMYCGYALGSALAPYCLLWNFADSSPPGLLLSHTLTGAISLACGIGFLVCCWLEIRKIEYETINAEPSRFSWLIRLKARWTNFWWDRWEAVVCVLFIVNIFLFFFVIVGGDSSLSSYLYIYQTNGTLTFSHTEITAFHTDYWLVFAASPLLVIVLNLIFQVELVVFLQLVCGLGASILLTSLVGDRTGFWAAIGLYTLFKGGLFPTGIAFVNKYSSVCGPLMVVIFFASQTGTLVLELLSGFLVTLYGANVILFFPGAQVLILLFLTITLMLLGYLKGERLSLLVHWLRRGSYASI